MTDTSITAYAPATVANVACAFDVLGFALERPGDEVTAERSSTPGVEMLSIEGDGGKLPLESERNTASVAVQALLKDLDSTQGIALRLKKGLPLGSGLGSSAASAVAAVVAANILLGSPKTTRELLPYVLEGERIACGTAHADNVAPSLLGGFVLIRSYSPLDVVEIEAPRDLHCSIVHPEIEVRTEHARKILKKDIPLRSAVSQWGNIAALIAGLLRSDYELIARSLHDTIIEPERSLLIPGFDKVKARALSEGALGCSISGSGPSIFALCRGSATAERVASSMQEEFVRVGIRATAFTSSVSGQGARQI